MYIHAWGAHNGGKKFNPRKCHKKRTRLIDSGDLTIHQSGQYPKHFHVMYFRDRFNLFSSIFFFFFLPHIPTPSFTRFDMTQRGETSLRFKWCFRFVKRFREKVKVRMNGKNEVREWTKSGAPLENFFFFFFQVSKDPCDFFFLFDSFIFHWLR